MMSLQSLQNELLSEVLPIYNKAVLKATTINDIETSTRQMFKQVKDLVFPHLILNLTESNDPQDL